MLYEHRELIGCKSLNFVWVAEGPTVYGLKCDKTDCKNYAICPYNTKPNLPSTKERKVKP